MTAHGLADHIFAERAEGSRPEWIADVLGRLVWLTADNGASICESLREWLASESEEKVAIALAFDEVCLWETEAEMNGVLSSVETRFARLAPLCTAARSRWKTEHRRS
jgi:hypothetical protein